MANKVLLKKSSVGARVPVVGDLDYGELALNYADGKLYYKTSGNAIDTFPSLSATATLTNKTLSSATLTGTLTAGGGVGTNGQVLASTGSGVQWVDQTGGGGSSNSFTTIAVAGQSNVVADSTTDTLTLAVTGVLSISTNATTDTITITTNKSFPFTKYDGNASNIPLYTEASTLANNLDTVYLPFVKSNGASVTTLKLTV